MANEPIGATGGWPGPAPARMRASRVALVLRRPSLLLGPAVASPVRARPRTTARLLLRPYEMRDAADWHRIQSSPEVCEFLPWPVRTRRQSRRHLRHRTHHSSLVRDGDFLALAVTLDGRVIGDVSLHLRGTAPTAFGAEIGWIVHPEHAGRGYAHEAARSMLALAFDELGANWTCAVIHEDNARSQALAARLGFAHVGERPEGQYWLLPASARSRGCA